jgi:FAD/FMN-containing dehydrogenase
MLFSLLVVLNLTLGSIYCFKWTLPGDSNWPSIDKFKELKSRLNGNAFIRGEPGYNPSTWNRITNTPKPAIIIKPKNANDVIESLRFAKNYNIRVSVLSTGHHQDHRNIFDNSVHLDMSSMTSKSINLAEKTLTLGPGNNFSQISDYILKQTGGNLVVLTGNEPGVGIYGWTVGGGHGLLTRIYGLGVDALVSIDLILSNLTLVTASETQNADLFRALRGSGGSAYGIAVSLTVKLYENPGKVSIFEGIYDLNNQTADMFSNWIKNAPFQASAFYLPTNLGETFVQISARCIGNASFCSSVLNPLKSGCIPIESVGVNCEPSLEKYQNFVEYVKSAPNNPNGVAYLVSTALNANNIEEALREVNSYIYSNPFTGCSGNAVLGGMSSTIDLNQAKTSVALSMRHSLMALTCFSAMEDKNTVQVRKSQVLLMDKLSETILKKYSSWVYWNEPQRNFPANDWKERYWGGLENYNKLLAVKNKYDPDNFFSCYHCVGYERVDNENPSVCPTDECTCSNTPQGACANTLPLVGLNGARRIFQNHFLTFITILAYSSCL